VSAVGLHLLQYQFHCGEKLVGLSRLESELTHNFTLPLDPKFGKGNILLLALLASIHGGNILPTSGNR
jgi:hypothetical protein